MCRWSSISQDVFPEIATALGRLTNPTLVSLLERLVAFYTRRADKLIVIGERMRDRLIAKGAAPDRIAVIPNWVDTDQIKPSAATTTGRERCGLHDYFVVMHSGNVGQAQNLDNLVQATTLGSRPRGPLRPDHRLRHPDPTR